ncbi:hypothetical protein BATDEDRAFT_22118 [Batrachochytrium dendrobatidis JAM81]|uniref:Cytochrome b561 domain-containing protein n=1 Tax=Batrachochytrium dendrobatidis (strain JAM81 / FGSC 10211) TaxID=684364 RepID=F4NSF9_BATDJ|nr:uncharacterized protein BATDEDRAFT_22118 [Batrachochytrium dendrobatidis JAM81]EGF84250.1 hypothetical protein BATDEDRAFT_22118 [Batrachochytrium dendrobatidis JAM81]|eukprot:XP_006675475.1 hypothetical protein BATDEDRAFT_22118 [Batrachochytrium dendrobatidis JAM81]
MQVLTSDVLLWLFCQSQSYCVIGGQDSSTGDIIFTIQSAAQGWAAFGVGPSMFDSTMYVGYINSTNGITLSTRDSHSHTLPQYSSDQSAKLSHYEQMPTPSWAKIVFTVQRPAIGPAKSIDSSSTFLFAMSDIPPESIDSPSSPFSYHTIRGIIRTLDLTSPAFMPAPVAGTNATSNGTAPNDLTLVIMDSVSDNSVLPILPLPPGVTYESILRAHGIMMFVAWTISPAIGIFIARYMKDRLGVWWFRLHVFFMFFVTGLLTIAAIILVVLYKTPPHFTNGFHRSFGLAIAIVMIIQIILGVICDRMFSPNRTSIPIWDKLHWIFGRSLAVAGMINIITGMSMLQSIGYVVTVGTKAGYGVIVGCILIGFIVAEVMLGQIHHGKIAPPELNDKTPEKSVF